MTKKMKKSRQILMLMRLDVFGVFIFLQVFVYFLTYFFHILIQKYDPDKSKTTVSGIARQVPSYQTPPKKIMLKFGILDALILLQKKN
jgi:hypothetical protein